MSILMSEQKATQHPTAVSAALSPAITPGEGALNQLWVASLPEQEARKWNGAYIAHVQVRTSARPDLDDPAGWVKLWEWCEAQGKVFDCAVE
jgi:hypothetical protein